MDVGESSARTMETDSHGVDTDAERCRDCGMVEILPCDQLQQLAVVGSEAGEGSGEGPGVVDVRPVLDQGRPLEEATQQVRATRVATPLVRKHAPGDTIEPRQRERIHRDVIEPAPCDRERLRGRVLRVGRLAAPPFMGVDVRPEPIPFRSAEDSADSRAWTSANRLRARWRRIPTALTLMPSAAAIAA